VSSGLEPVDQHVGQPTRELVIDRLTCEQSADMHRRDQHFEGQSADSRRESPCSTCSGPPAGGADQLIRWAKFTMNPSGPRTDAMRQMSSY
jgi:hypothetical protein